MTDLRHFSDLGKNGSVTESSVGSNGLKSLVVTSSANISKPRTADGGDGLMSGFVVNDGMVLRVTYVLLGFTFLMVIYFGVKFWRLRRRKTNIRRYDVLTTQRVATDIGMDSGSEDELFDDAQAKLVRATTTNGVTGRNTTR